MAAAISVGLALTLANGWSRRVIAALVGVTVVVAFVVPLSLIRLDYHSAVSMAMWSFVMAAVWLLTPLAARASFTVEETLSAALYWDVIATLVTIGVLGATIWAWQRRLSDTFNAKSVRETDLDDASRPAVETVLVVD